MKPKETLPLALLALVLGPATVHLLREPPAPPPVEVALVQSPVQPRRVASPEEWFQGIRRRCTPGDVRLATDLNPPPPGVEGVGYKAACYALARQTASARALLLGLPEEARAQGASRVYEVGQALAAEGRHDLAGPLMELVLEFWPNHDLALYHAGSSRFATGDPVAAHGFLGKFLDLHGQEDDLTADARRMMEGSARRQNGPLR